MEILTICNITAYITWQYIVLQPI